jgi:hypothetical protein
MSIHGERIIDRIGDEIDRLEKKITSKHPEGCSQNFRITKLPMQISFFRQKSKEFSLKMNFTPEVL